MKLQRFIGDFNLKSDLVDILDDDLVNQFRNVFRFDVRDRVVLCDGASNEAIAEIIKIGKKSVELKVVERSTNKTEAKNYSILYCAILKKENFELAVQKAVEVGVKEIVPVVTDRTVKLNLNFDRLNKIIREAAEQSGRGSIMKLREPQKFVSAIGEIPKGRIDLLFDETGEDIFESFKGVSNGETIGGWVGPEGGWTAEELLLAKQKGLKAVSLGKTTLRGETAAIVASYLISNI